MYEEQANELGYASLEEALADGWSSAEIASTQIENGPEGYWYIDSGGETYRSYIYDESWTKPMKQIGNYFETREEAEKAVEKLKAFKRLKDKGFEFRWIDKEAGTIKYAFFLKSKQEVNRFDYDDLDLLFGGEE